MTAVLQVLDPGARTSVQDEGFRAARAQGVPQAGVLDRDGLVLLNALLGNPAGTEALEIALTPPRLRVEGAPVTLALGDTLSGTIFTPGGKERPLPAWTRRMLAEGDELALALTGGALGLLGVTGGFDLPEIFGSRSTLLRAGFGGFHGRALQKGDRLTLRDTVAADPETPELRIAQPPAPDQSPIRVVRGPQDRAFTAASFVTFFNTAWHVGLETDRMGMRLEGPTLGHRGDCGPDVISEGVAPGSIQVPGSGQPIVLLADAQTTGGYTKIATVIGADLSRLATRAPGARVRFADVTVAEAEVAARAGRARLEASIASIEVAVLRGRLDLRRLYAANLIDGVIDVRHPDPSDPPE